MVKKGRPAWRTTKEAAKLLDCCPQHILKFVKAGKLKAYIGKNASFKYKLQDIEQLQREEFLLNE
jgi:predicted site-specific integrase-resolvase